MFRSLHETAIDTILLCFCMDKEANEGLGEMKAGAHLQEFVSNNKKKDDGTKSDESRGRACQQENRI